MVNDTLKSERPIIFSMRGPRSALLATGLIAGVDSIAVLCSSQDSNFRHAAVHFREVLIRKIAKKKASPSRRGCTTAMGTPCRKDGAPTRLSTNCASFGTTWRIWANLSTKTRLSTNCAIFGTTWRLWAKIINEDVLGDDVLAGLFDEFTQRKESVIRIKTPILWTTTTALHVG